MAFFDCQSGGTIPNTYEMTHMNGSSERLTLYLSSDILSNFTKLTVNKNGFITGEACYYKALADGNYAITASSGQSYIAEGTEYNISDLVSDSYPNICFISGYSSSLSTSNIHWTITLS